MTTTTSPHPTLPQSDTAEGARARQAQLAHSREEVRYNYTYLGTLAFAETVPRSQHPSVAWRIKLAETVSRILRNTFYITRHEPRWGRIHLHLKFLFGIDREKIQNEVLDAVLEGSLPGRLNDIGLVEKMFVDIKCPPHIEDSQTDAYFAHMRVAGPNPMVIRQVHQLPPNFQVTDGQFQAVMGLNDGLTKASAEQRLYLADYAGLADVQAGTFPSGQKFLAAPLALFAVPASGDDRALRPVAIQCGQEPGAANPVFTPHDRLAWQVAKAFVEMADGNYHQAISHLGETHLVLEPIVLATCRQLALVHPLSILLMPHFEGTLSINDAAQANLMATGGGVDRVMGGTIEVSRHIAASAAQNYPFNQAALPIALAARGVDDASALPGFPYRDDGLLVWAAVRKWVDGYLRLYYKTDADVQADTELQAWIAEMVSPDGGRMKDIGQGGRIHTLDYLIVMVSHIIFTAGPQHAAVNFPQYPVMSYTPNMPLALYKSPPQTRDVSSEHGFMDWMPPSDMIQLQMSLGYLLGNARDTELGVYAHTDAGDFGRCIADHLKRFLGATSYFADWRVGPLLTTFHADLKHIEKEIGRRNLTRRPYGFLLPSNIPQSINV